MREAESGDLDTQSEEQLVIAWSLKSGSDVETYSEPWLSFIDSSDQDSIHIFYFHFVPFSCV